MANYPTSLDDNTSLPEPSTDDTILAADDTNRSQAIKAIETKVGINSSTPAANQVLRSGGAGESDWGQVEVADVNASGTADGTTFLRGDGQWATPAGGGGGISNVVDDATPQLGGNLDVNGNSIVSVSNADINILPNGTGKTIIDGDLELDNFGAVNATYVRNGPDNLGLQVEAGDATSGTAGNLILNAGDASTGTGGDVIIKAGTGSTAEGSVKIQDVGGVFEATLDVTGLTADRTVTFPDSDVTLGAGGGASAIDDLTDVDTDKSKTPADGDVLTFDGTDWNAEAAAGGGGGGNPYGADLVVATAGGDHTTLTAALDAASAGDTIFVQDSVTETSSPTTAPDNVTVVAKGRQTIVTFNTTWTLPTGLTLKGLGIAFGTAGSLSGTNQKIVIDDCDIDMDSGASSSIMVYSGEDSKITNCFLFNDSTTNLNQYRRILMAASRFKFTNNHVRLARLPNLSNYVMRFSGAYVQINDNVFEATSTTGSGSEATMLQHYSTYGTCNNNIFECDDSNGKAVRFQGLKTTCSGNNFKGWRYTIQVVGENTTITGNNIDGRDFADTCIDVATNSAIITGNCIEGQSSTVGLGINVADNVDDTVISGNTIKDCLTGINIAGSGADKTVIVGNSLADNLGTAISDSGTGTINANNAT